MSIPDSLAYKIKHFKRYGRLVTDGYDLFGTASWLAVHIGQLNMPERHDPLLHHRNTDGNATLKQLRNAMISAGEAMPTHMDYIREFCKS
jgi:tryptophan halogenase